MPHYLFDLYSAFTGSAFGGSHAGIIYDGEGLDTEEKEKILTYWKDIITYMSFTTTTFDEEDDAIYYFGKMFILLLTSFQIDTTLCFS